MTCHGSSGLCSCTRQTMTVWSAAPVASVRLPSAPARMPEIITLAPQASTTSECGSIHEHKESDQHTFSTQPFQAVHPALVATEARAHGGGLPSITTVSLCWSRIMMCISRLMGK